MKAKSSEDKRKQTMKKTIFVKVLVFLLFISSVFAITFSGTSEGDTYSSTNTAQGSITERQVSGTDSESIPSSGIIFSWGAPLGNGTNIFGGDTYFITIGPVLEEEEEIVKKEEGYAPPSVPVVAIPASGGGSAGSSSKEKYGLVVGDKLTILVNQKPHTIAVEKVGEDWVLLTVQSTAQTLKITVGETTAVDLEADGIEDVYLSLDSVSDLRNAQITVEEILADEQQEEQKEKPIIEPLKRVTGAVVGLAATEMQDLEASITQGIKTTLQTGMPILGVVLLGLLLSSLFTAKYVQQRRLYVLSNEVEKEELVQQELKKMRIYAQYAFAKGHSQEHIKQELLRTGWQEEEVNTAIVDTLLDQENKLNQLL